MGKLVGSLLGLAVGDTVGVAQLLVHMSVKPSELQLWAELLAHPWASRLASGLAKA